MPDSPNVIVATPTWSLNGPNVFSASLVRGLNARRVPAHIVLTRPDWLDTKPQIKPPDIPFATLPVSRFMSFRARCTAMIRYLEAHAPCIYIPNYDFGHSCISSQLSGSVAIVGIVHSDDPWHYDHVVRLGGYWNALVAVSSAIAAETRRLAPALASRLSTIPYGVAAAENLPDRSSEGSQPLRVIYAGRLDQEQKRALDLPEIVQAVTALGVPIHLTIAGSGGLAGQLKAECAGQPVEFLGTLESAALSRIFAGQDVCLLTSAYEGLPIGILEAMGQGCIPVVADIRSGIPELVEDGVNGFRVPVGDIRGFAHRLAELYRDSGLRRRMARAAWTKARSDCYRTDRMVESYAALFARLPDTAKARPTGSIKPPPNLPWPERLPGAVQMCGHLIRQLATSRNGHERNRAIA